MLTPAAPLDTQFARLLALEDGWYDATSGRGKAIDRRVATLARLFFDALAATGSPTPHLYPTEEGGIRAEWSTPGRCEVSIDFDASDMYLHSLNVATDEWEEIVAPHAANRPIAHALARLLVT